MMDSVKEIPVVEHPLTQKKIPAFASGVITPVFTPALPGKRLDPKGLANYIDWLSRDQSITTLFVRCGVGQMYTFSLEEVREAIKVSVDSCQGRKYLFFGTMGRFDGSTDMQLDRQKFLDETIELSLFAQEQGATGIVLLVPWGIQPDTGETLEDMEFDYFSRVAREIEKPILIYNTPGMPPRYNLTPSLVKRLAALPNLAGAKVSTSDLFWFSRLEEATHGSPFALISGHEGVYLQSLVTGCLGVIGQGCNLYPSILRSVHDAFRAGDLMRARRSQSDALAALSLFDGYGSSTSGLAFLRLRGLDIQPFDKSGEPFPNVRDIELIGERLDMILRKYR